MQKKVKKGVKKVKKVKIIKPLKKSKSEKVYFGIGIGLSLIALFFLILNAAIGLGLKNYLIELFNIPQKIVPVFIFLCIFWLVLALLLILSISLVINQKEKWFYFLVLAILALLSLRIETSLLLFIASFLFWLRANLNKVKTKRK